MKKGKFSKLIVALSVVLVLLYTIISLILQFVTQTEVSATLTTCFYSFFTVEMLSLAGIKTRKIKYDTYTESEVNENDC